MLDNIYFYIFILFVWVIFVFNSFYQNHKMKHFWPNKIKELFTIPFYIFIFVSLFISSEKFVSLILENQSKSLGNINSNYFHLLVQILGIFLCCLSVALYTYVNFFEKSFPSCITTKNKGVLRGIYNYIRHPSYYFLSFIVFGTAFCLLNPILIILACINHISIYFFYMLEEKQIAKDNAYYADYLKKTKRFLPRFHKFSN